MAAPINYGDVDDIPNGGVVEYLQVTESTATDVAPLFGAPDVTINQLDFEPVGFGASASNGEIDITDGQLNFEFVVGDDQGIQSLVVTESGEFSFLGSGPNTSVNYSLFAQVVITEVDGIALAPEDWIVVTSSNSMSESAPGGFLPNTGWALGTLLEFVPSLVSAGFTSESVVTAGEFRLNNTLIAESEQGTLAFLAKKDFTIIPGDPIDRFVVPEPASALLVVFAAAGVVARRR